MRSGSLIAFSALIIAAALGGARTAQAQAKIDAQAADRGKKIWNSKQCFGCHELGRQQATGPDLIGVTDRRSNEWLHSWLKDPMAMTGSDTVAMALKKQYGSQMPKLGLTDPDADALIAYLAQQTAMKRGGK
jgi:nitrite reductase (NO-forming)/hydroxylamine reductase